MKKLTIIISAVIMVLLLCSCVQESISQNIEFSDTIPDSPETENETKQETTRAQFEGGEWYLSEWEQYPVTPTEAENFDEANALFVKLPLVYEENANGLIIKVEFFQEIYTLHSLIQCRVTYTNTTGEYLSFNAKNEYTPGAFNRVGTNHYHCVYRSKHFGSVYQQNIFRVGLENGESFSNESVIIMEDYFFIEGYDYSFCVEVLSHDKNAVIGEYTEHKISIPIELCTPKNN